MPNITDELCVAIDGGTTNTRARLFRGEACIATAARPVGVRNVAIDGSREPLVRAVSECLDDVTRVTGSRIDELGLACASGMLTSNVGLHEVPHVVAPAGLNDLARGVVAVTFAEFGGTTIHLVPGVKTLPPTGCLPLPLEEGRSEGGWPRAAEWDSLATIDILRGEESETFGILAPTGWRGPLAVLLPGSHTKLVHVDAANRIVGSYTTIAGELMQALAERTVLATSIHWPPTGEPIWPAVDAGAEFAARWGLMRGGFAVRLADVVLKLDRAARTWFFVGLAVGSDVNELTRIPNWPRYMPCVVGGREPLRSAYGRLLRAVGHGAVEVLDGGIVELAAARGAIAIARRARA